MAINNRISIGLERFAQVIDMLRLGDPVVWQVDFNRFFNKVM